MIMMRKESDVVGNILKYGKNRGVVLRYKDKYDLKFLFTKLSEFA